jgi:UDP-N-acetylglucosamine acyltransferase
LTYDVTLKVWGPMAITHPTAIIGENVSIGNGAQIGAYAILEDGVTVGDRTVIGAHAILRNGTAIGANCLIDSFAVIGGLPQDESFDHTVPSGVTIADGTTVRECVTINRATGKNMATVIGKNCMLQSCCHVGHDCAVGDGTVIGTGAMLGGKARVGKKCFIGGGAAIHQRVVVGDYAILGGNSATALDIPPYTMAAGLSTVVGLNLVALGRTNIPSENIGTLKNCFREFYVRRGIFRDRAKAMIGEGFGSTEETKNFLGFFLRNSPRGFAPKRRSIK